MKVPRRITKRNKGSKASFRKRGITLVNSGLHLIVSPMSINPLFQLAHRAQFYIFSSTIR